jgi:hypothetical protein
MGHAHSRKVDDSNILVNVLFGNFIHKCCTTGAGKFSPLQTLEAAFATYLKQDTTWQTYVQFGCPMQTAHRYVFDMCLERGFVASPGYVCEAYKVDTRLIIGLAVHAV